MCSSSLLVCVNDFDLEEEEEVYATIQGEEACVAVSLHS